MAGRFDLRGAGAAAIIRGVGGGLSTGVGAVATSIVQNVDDQDNEKGKTESKPAPIHPAIELARPTVGTVVSPAQSEAMTSASVSLPSMANPERKSVNTLPLSESRVAEGISMPAPSPGLSRIEEPGSPGNLPLHHPAADPGTERNGGNFTSPFQPQQKGQVPLSSREELRPSGSMEVAAPSPGDELARQGWTPIKHSGGGALQDVEREVPGLEDEAADATTSSRTTDPGAHADKERNFDIEAPVGHSASHAPALDSTSPRQSRKDGKVDTVLHTVDRNENFWTISRMYYDSGRYYRALWKANADRVPEIDKLYLNTVIRIPPPEDLDPTYIDPPGTRGPRSGDHTLARQGVDSVRFQNRSEGAVSGRGTPTEGVPIRRSGHSNAELNLPISDVVAEQEDNASQNAQRRPRPGRDQDRGPVAEPRDAVTRPIYKVRQYDTLRTIARDAMGDARRADEILDLNRDIIEDAGHLIVGQILELPEDARIIRPRARRMIGDPRLEP
jgi:nucleoid-associated protein YgaU